MDKENGYILIGIVSAILFIFLLGFIIILLIYRKRKLEHASVVEGMNERFSKELLQTQIEVQQQTMKHIGREIHDNIGQRLTLAALYSQQMDHEKLYPKIEERLGAVSKIINESLNELRSLSKKLTSDYIAQSNVIAIIKNECDKLNASGFCRVNFRSNTDNVDASYNVKNIIVRIIQEFMQNSLKHANCSIIDIDVDLTNKGLEIITADNGKGFVTNEKDGKGIGLINIKNRVEAIGAFVSIESAPLRGTKMTLIIPSTKIN